MASPSSPPVYTLDLKAWDFLGPPQREWQEALESGRVLYCPGLAFRFTSDETRYLDPAFSDTKRKSIYLRADRPGVWGTAASLPDRQALESLLKRFQIASLGLVAGMFPGYVGQMNAASTSFRPRATGEGHEALSWRKDDTRLHVDAFPSNPPHGMRILRVFSNVGTSARVWRIGEPFESMARHFLPRIRGPLPVTASILQTLGITKRRRSPYDHYMLQLHDRAKSDPDYQAQCEQTRFEFAPGTTWICYSDQVMHAAMAGQFMMEQTVHVPMTALGYPEYAPVSLLQKLVGRPLLMPIDAPRAWVER